ncbi:MAG TPA: DUF2383 domain-containing protein [Casimicrobiaceae bacterium]|nr:DUF2383 domain-containing protein [Casimicrobiaceae bacterium]
MKPEDLNKCLRGELSAIQTYRQALEKNRKEYGQHGGFGQLSRILQEHEASAAQLTSLIRETGGTPSTDAGAWGTWAQAVMGTAKLFGDKAALKALKEGEESGVKDYQSVVEGDDASSATKNAIAPLLTRQREHIRTLDRLLETAA